MFIGTSTPPVNIPSPFEEYGHLSVILNPFVNLDISQSDDDEQRLNYAEMALLNITAVFSYLRG
ncbi:MAG TPA: hypothetical protein VJ761_16035 [Ktedonobacteraceae bacterium]|nr:hypothetical protein [Ktedonobacteraceae bacterium]